ncbi:MAG: IclR family transcriptional regulator [Nocardioides sp.]
MTVIEMEPRAERAVPTSMVERMTLILDLFVTREQVRTLEQVSRHTGLPRSSAHRILEQLVRLQWLHHGPRGYALGARSLGLGGGEGEHGRLRAVAAPYLQDLLLRTGAVVHLAVLDGSDVRYLDKLGGRTAVEVPSRVGGLAPAELTGLGRAMLAWLGPEEVDARLGVAPTELHQELGRVRARGGLAVEHGSCVPGLSCAAAALRGPHGPVAAISVTAAQTSGPDRAAPLVLDAARRISEELFGSRAGRREPVRVVSRPAARAI